MKYDVTITNIGDFVLQFMQTRESVIIFNKNVPYEYMNMVVAHTVSEVKEDVVVGDKVYIADHEYVITAIGDEALNTLRKDGHCTFVFNGADSVSLPGNIALKGDGVPRFMVGDSIRIE